MYYENYKKKTSQNRTIGISSNSLNFLQKEVIKIKKNLSWKINKIEIYNEQNNEPSKEDKILNFSNNDQLFSIIKNNNLYKLLNRSLIKNKNFKKIKIKNKSFYFNIFKNQKHDLFINCDERNLISKKYFNKKFVKNYKSTAYVSIINHNKINNQKAIQIFTRHGPIAFLPVSKTQTSIVYSIKNRSINNNLKLSQKEFKRLIIKNNKIYKINFINDFETFELSSKITRNYFYKNILAFGNILHQIHPLSGQGFNMSIRDIKVLLGLIKNKLNLGLPVDTSIYEEFENKTKHLNFFFASGNDLIYEFFNYNNILFNILSKKIINNFNKNKLLNNLAINYANKGLII